MKMCFALGLCLLWFTQPTTAGDPYSVYVPDSKSKQLIALRVRTTSAGVTIAKEQSLELTFGASNIALSPERNQLIVGSDGKGPSDTATVNVLDEGLLQMVGSSSLPNPSGYTSVDRTGRFYLTAHYMSGTVAVYHLNPNGMVGAEACVAKTPNPEAHCVLTTPDNRFVYIPCVKNSNALYQFAFDADSGELKRLSPFDASPPAMFGPRHVAYHPKLPIAYFSNEQQLGISVYKIGDDGQLTDIQHATTTYRREPYIKGKRDLHASDLVLTPDGKRAFVAVRDFVGDRDSVFTFRVEDDGRLSQIAQTPTGDIPWKLALSPDAEHLLVSESGEGKLTIYRNLPSGKLTKAASYHLKFGARDLAVW